MRDQALILRDDANLCVSFSQEAERLKADALAISGTIGKVENPEDQAQAVEAQTALKSILTQAEKARKACKEPVLEFGRRIDNAARKFCDEINDEMTRISALVGTYQQLELAKARAAEAARQKELTELERQRQEALAKATSHDALDAVNEHFDRKTALTSSQVIEPPRVEGQRVATDWDVQVVDIHALYRCHANCVELKPRLSEIKSLLKMGVKVTGINATPIVKATVRVPTAARAIDV